MTRSLHGGGSVPSIHPEDIERFERAEGRALKPPGALGILEPPEIKLVEGFSPKELELIRVLKARQIGAMRFLAK